MEEKTRNVRRLQMVVHKRPSDVVDEHQMACLRAELSQYGMEHLALIQSGEITVSDARLAVRVKAGLADARFNLSHLQHEEILKIGYRSAGVLREQMSKAS